MFHSIVRKDIYECCFFTSTPFFYTYNSFVFIVNLMYTFYFVFSFYLLSLPFPFFLSSLLKYWCLYLKKNTNYILLNYYPSWHLWTSWGHKWSAPCLLLQVKTDSAVKSFYLLQSLSSLNSSRKHRAKGQQFNRKAHLQWKKPSKSWRWGGIQKNGFVK